MDDPLGDFLGYDLTMGADVVYPNKKLRETGVSFVRTWLGRQYPDKR